MQLLNQPNQVAEFTQGDTAVLELMAVNDQGNPVDLTGATLETAMLGSNIAGVVNFQNSQHTIANQSTNRGQFFLTLSSDDTLSVGEGRHKQILTSVAVSSTLTTFRGINILTVYPPVPIQ